MLLSNQRIRLRAPEPEDLDILYKWENDTQMWEYGSATAPYSRLALRQYLSEAQCCDIYQSKQLRLMIDTQEAAPKTVGAVDLFDFDPLNRRVAVGIVIDDAHHRKGYACDAMQLTAEYAFNHLNMKQIYAFVATDNTSSYKMLQKLGYVQAGTLKAWKHIAGEFRDAYIMQLINS